MILADEADVLEEAFYRADVSDVSTLEYLQEDLKQYVNYLGIERDVVPELHPYFNINTEARCEKHNISIDSCGCPETREAETTIYSLKPGKLVNEWVRALREQDVFDSLALETVSDTRYVLTAWLDRTEITFQCFFDRSDFEQYDFEPRALEFGVSFFGDHSAVEREYCYSWRQFLDDRFREDLTREVRRLKETVGADFYEYRPLEDFRDRVRQSLRQYFSESGYEVRREVGEVCPVETTQYGIDTGKTDFVASKGDSDYIVCHCEKTPGWHVHHFSDGRIESAEQTAIIKDMTDKIEKKINTFLDIQTDKKTASRFVTVISTLFSVFFVVLLFDRLGSISSFLREQFNLGGGLEAVGVALLIFDAIAVIILVVVITRPYYLDARFGWEIDPFEDDGDSGDTNG
jgi:hypothetical protein